ncbi:MAG: methyl-accepting chemotaxis protein [Spirochaetales bacterium]|nr:methyl-accepting chemotaxis protein [Exilispira sp.]NMC67019.1 methyl-accepting chemotaxis protein [Spirochaetales bacterium]
MKLRNNLLIFLIPLIIILMVLSGVLIYQMVKTYALDLIDISLKTKFDDIDGYIIRIKELGAQFDISEDQIKSMVSTYVINNQIGQKGYSGIYDFNGERLFFNISSKIKKEDIESPIFEALKKYSNFPGKTIQFNYNEDRYHARFMKLHDWNWYLVIGASDSEYLAPIQTLIEYIAIIVGSLVVLASIVVFILSAQVSKPISQLQKGMKKIVETNTFINIETKDSRIDEVNTLKDSINTLIESFSLIISDVKKEFSILEKHIEDNVQMSSKIESAISHFSDLIKDIMVSIEEVVSHNTEIVEKINEVASESKISLITVENSSAVLNDFKLKTQNLIKQIESMTNAVTSISEISDQTNLLSLNAAIESAKAGEVGKGFEVVSSEIRKLADESDKITKNISKTIKQLKNELRDFLEKYQQLYESFVKIQNDITRISDINTFVNNASESQKANLDRIADSISEINMKFEEFKIIGDQLLSDSKETRNTIDNLLVMVSKYKTNIENEEITNK